MKNINKNDYCDDCECDPCDCGWGNDIRGISSGGEHLLCTQGVNGSNPLFSTFFLNEFAGVTQW